MKHRTERDRNKEDGAHPVSVALFWLIAVLLGTSSWWRAGNRSLPLIWLELLALAVLAGLLWLQLGAKRHDPAGRIKPWALGVVLSAPLWVALVQLVPWRGTGPASLAPDETWLSALAGFPIVATLAAALAISQSQVLKLILLCAIVGALQGLLGLLQLAFPALLFEPAFRVSVLGSFGNKNSLGNYLAMLLPLLWLWAAGLGAGATRHLERFRWQAWGARAGLMLVLASLVASLSRAGLATGVLVLTLAVALLPFGESNNMQRGWRVIWRWWPLALVLLGLSLGSWEWLGRFDSDRLASDDAWRGLMREQTWSAALANWPLGSGVGTFGVVFPAYQPPELGRNFVNFAHNDYLQLLMECGVLVVPVALALLWLIGRRLVQLTSARWRGPWSHSDALAVACGLGFLAQALHAWVDYPWRIPATAMLGAFLLGVFLREPESVSADRRSA